MRQGLFFFAIFFLLASCGQQSATKENIPTNQNKGKLYIIGGGKRPTSMIKELIELAGVDEEGFIAILPMSSIEPDSAFFYAKKQFVEQGINLVFDFNFEFGEKISQQKIDSLKQAKLIYISGGDQNKFMKVVRNSPILEAIKFAYKEGAVIAGTSAGAAVMSKKMITGNEFKYPEYTGNFRTIEANNIEIAEGTGLLENCIIDQHFIWRMRMNRLITASLENPKHLCIGIDESTAIIVDGDSAQVTGESQVVVLNNPSAARTNEKEQLAGSGLSLSVYFSGDKFSLLP